MNSRIICFITLISCCSCSTSFSSNRDLFNQRSPIANSLENKLRYADALTQWKILLLAYPEDEIIIAHIRRLESLISNGIIEQLSVLDKGNASGNEKLARNAYLKILALDPSNEIAMEALRKLEWKSAIAEASSKTANIKKYFVETQQKAKVSIQLTKYIEQGEQFSHDKKYKALLLLADKFENLYPSNANPNEYRILAYTKLGEEQQERNNSEEAIFYYQQAISVASIKGDTLDIVQMKKDELSELLANKHFKLANKLFKTNLDSAIENFELCLKYQPSHTKARQLMQRAVKIRRNLLKIKRLNANSD